ncbi:MAG TPA: transaldolase family protein [Gemmatimonadaceae bacterium]|jgi:transaldolase|nr:transaldolase family protein [Gemmatimonadaceae bacterium]
MNIFLESASIDEIREAASAGFADGVIFSESAYSEISSGNNPREAIGEIAQEFAIPICVEVGAISGDDMYHAARDLAKISDHIVVQLPLVEDAVVPMHRLSSEGIGVCATYVFNGAQAVLASKAGASMVRVSLHDLDAQGQTSTSAVTEIRTLLSMSECECDVMVASPRTTTQFTECINAGAQIVCVAPDVLRSLLLHPLTDRGLDRFLSSLSKRPRTSVE